MRDKFPLGLQSFVKIRTDHYIYVDKTEYIYQLVHNGVPYFLSRPRRFGKSLLLSTMKAYWEGRKELFSGLAIEKLEKGNPDAWKQYPVFYFDFNGANYETESALEDIIDEQLRRFEKTFNIKAEKGFNLGERFRNLIMEASKTTGLRCVILVDEYDKPLLDVMDDKNLQEYNKKVFKGFFSTLKGFDDYIQFAFITGVSRFHKVSIFSDLNQLRDISLAKDYEAICGITESELQKYFRPGVEYIAQEQDWEYEECLSQLKQAYDGYHFYPNGIGVYNPFSLLNAILDGEINSYWFSTGTPTFLIKQLRQNHFDVRKFTNQTIYASESALKDYTGDTMEVVPLLYQTGYLTISSFDRTRRRYTLCFPNEEVKYGLLESLMPAYVPASKAGSGLDIFTIDEYIENGDVEGIRNVLTALFAGITYTLERDPFEHYFQAVIYLVFTLLGRYTLCEMHTYTGRIDCKVETRDYIYLFEFKCDEPAEAALAQIDTKDYALPFTADTRKLYKIGVSFDSQTRKLTGWAVL